MELDISAAQSLPARQTSVHEKSFPSPECASAIPACSHCVSDFADRLSARKRARSLAPLPTLQSRCYKRTRDRAPTFLSVAAPVPLDTPEKTNWTRESTARPAV